MESAKITLAQYAADNNSMKVDQWKRLRPYNRKRRYIMKMIACVLARKKTNVKFKLGYK